jgi:hypothetical protein
MFQFSFLSHVFLAAEIYVTHFLNPWASVNVSGPLWKIHFEELRYHPTCAPRDTPIMTCINSYTFRHRGASLRHTL